MDVERHTYDDGSRYYTDGESEILSVTTVLDYLEEDKSGLEYWKDQNDGSDDNPFWQHIFWYSAPRGTLCHYQALKLFEDAYDGGGCSCDEQPACTNSEECPNWEDGDMWGEEEAESMRKVVEGPSEDAYDDYDNPNAPKDLESVTYSILKDEGIVDSREQYQALFADSTTLADVLRDDVDFFTDKFEYICDELGVDGDSVLRVEKFMLEADIGVAGQTDLVYEDPNGDVVVADLKTSSGLRQKHRLQSVAYMKAVEASEWGPDEVDRIEVWRIAPSKRNFEVHSHEVPEHADEYDWYTDDYWFEDEWGEFEYDSIDDMWQTFKRLSDKAHDETAN